MSMSKNKNKPVKSFEITFLGKWYFVEIHNLNKIEIYTESNKNIDKDKISSLVNYLKNEGFLDEI